MKLIYVFCYIALFALNIYAIKAEPEARNEEEQPSLELKKEDNQELINPIVDQDYTEKEHDKRTIFPTFNNFGWAKHVKVRGGQKYVLGYSPVDLKYVPVIKPFGKGGWRFRQRQPAYNKRRPVMHLLPVHPKPDTHGWKPIVPAHVPPPQQPGQHQGWNKPGVTVLKPIRPSAPDHHHEHEHHDHHDHNVDHVDLHPVSVPVPTVVPTVVPTIIPTVVPTIVPESTHPHVHVLDDHHHNHHGHVLGLGDFGHDHHYHHVDYPHPVTQVPHVYYYNHVHPGIHVPKPDLPVLPLGASFPINVQGIHGLPGVVPTVHTPHHVDVPVSPAIPAYPGIVPTAAAPVIPEIPHVHYTHPPHLVPQVPHYDIPAFPQHFNIIQHAQPVPEVVHEVPAPHLHRIPVPIPPPQVPHYHINTPGNFPAVPQVPHTHYHIPQVHEHVPEVHEHHADLPPVQPLPQPAATHIPIPTHNNIQTVEYHGHLAHLVKQHQHQQLQQNAHQYVPEHYNPQILPGSTGALTSAFLNPGFTDLQIPDILPQHPNYPSSHDDAYYDQGQFLPDGVTQPAFALEPPNK